MKQVTLLIPLLLQWTATLDSVSALSRPEATLSFIPANGGDDGNSNNNSNTNSSTVVVEEPKKQGAYGKVKLHKEQKWQQLLHMDEVVAAVVVLLVKQRKYNLNSQYIHKTFAGKLEDLVFCQDILSQVSRSFSSVIQQLPETLVVDVLIFYLVLRALDTIEDDTQAFEGDIKRKVNYLKTFYKTALQDPVWTMGNVGEGAEQRLLQEFPRVYRIYASLSIESQTVISDITKRMGAGMAEFANKDLSQGTLDLTQYNRYCHYVAGLVGEGLSRLFANSGLEDASFFSGETVLSNQMGMFLQKTNIIRDYLEDNVEGRAFWPQSIWKPHTTTKNNDDDYDDTATTSTTLGYFQNQTDPTIQTHSIRCLNELITDALDLVPACLAYLSELQCLEIFRFCAVPQVMAIATLSKCYANADVFTGVVKIRKGLSCKLMLRTNNLEEVQEIFYTLAKSIESKALRLRRSGFIDPCLDRTLDACDVICAMTEAAYQRQRRAKLFPMLFVSAVLACQFVPVLNIVLAVVSLLNYIFGPFRLNQDPNIRAADQLIKQTWREVMGKK